MFRRTKIVGTLGPATDDPAVMRDMVAAGLDIARINFSHGTHDQHRETIATIRLRTSLRSFSCRSAFSIKALSCCRVCS